MGRVSFLPAGLDTVQVLYASGALHSTRVVKQ